MLLFGGTGMGKSVALRNMILHCIQHSEDIKFFGIDLLKLEFKPFASYHDVTPGIALDLRSAYDLLANVFSELQTRYTQMNQEGVNHFTKLVPKIPAYLVLIDEAYSLLSAPDYGPTDTPETRALKEDITALVSRIVRLGRAAGVYLVLSSQQPLNLLSLELRNQFSTLYLTLRLDPESSLEWFDSSIASEIPRPNRGRGLTSFYNQQSIIQGYYVSHKDIHQAIAHKTHQTPS